MINKRYAIRNNNYNLNINTKYDNIKIELMEITKQDTLIGDDNKTQVYVYSFKLHLKDLDTEQISGYQDRLYIPTKRGIDNKYNTIYDEIHTHFNNIIDKFNDYINIKKEELN